MRWKYRFFDFLLDCNFCIPHLSAVESSTSPRIDDASKGNRSVRVHLGTEPEQREAAEIQEETGYVSPYLDISGEPTLRIWGLADGSTHRLGYTNGLTFWVNSEGNAIQGVWSGKASIDDALGYLLGPVLGIFLRLRGETCLHASAVTFDDHAVVFVGPPGAGKSTTAAAFALADTGRFPTISFCRTKTPGDIFGRFRRIQHFPCGRSR